MIYAAVKPIEEYDVVVLGQTVGLYQSYGYRPELLALVFLTIPFVYDYEGGRPIEKRRVSLTDDRPLIDSLPFEVAGQSISSMMRTMNPIEIINLLRMADNLDQLPIAQKLYRGRPSLLLSFVGARAAAWAINYRGKIETTGNLIKASFGGKSKTAFEIASADLLMHQTIMKQGKQL